MKRTALSVLIFFLLFGTIGFPQYVKEDLEVIIEKAEGGNAYYQGVLGAIYRRGERGKIDLDKALKWLELSATRGDPIGLFNLGLMYQLGQKVDGDTLKAKDLFTEAFPKMKKMAESGNPRAQAALGTMYQSGRGVSKDLDETLKWVEESAEQGFPRAISALSRMYFSGLGVGQDYGQAKEWSERLAATGDENAKYNLGRFYAFGLGAEKDFDKAVEIYKKYEYPNEVYRRWGHEGDCIIPNLLPPKRQLEIEEGSCGEACLWSILNAKGVDITQMEINHEAGFPGRGLHAYELTIPLKKHKIKFFHREKSVETSDSSLTTQRYRDFLYQDVIAKVKEGNPVLIGVKVLPTRFPEWPLDHFILIVGYNETANELIYNDFNHRKRIPAQKLLDEEPGYSFINEYNFVYAIEFTDFQE